MKTLHGSMKEMEAKKRVLEEAVDALNEEMSKVRAEGKPSFAVWISAVHRSRRAGAGAGVFPYFAGAGVCSPPAKLRQHLFVLQTSIIDQRKN